MTFIPLPTEPGGAVRVAETRPPETKTIGPEAIIAAAQTFTASPWVDMGAEIPTTGVTHLGVWLNLDVNNSNDMRIRALAKHTSAGTEEYYLPIRVLSATDVKVEPGYIEFNQDVDQKIMLSIPLDGVVPFVQLRIEVGVLGAPAAQVLTAYTTKAWVGAGGGF